MPHLIYGGRLWRFASDELSIPASCAASSRCLWSVLLLIIMGLAAQSIEECSGQGYYIMGYLIASLCVQIVNVVCEVCIIRHSIKGTMVDSKPRAEVASYLTLHLSLAVLQLACAVYGLLVIHLDFIPCNSVISEGGMTVLLYVVIISQLVDISGIFCCATMFSSRTVDVQLHVDEAGLSPHSAHSREARCSGSAPGGHLEHPDLGLLGPSGEDLLQWEKRCGSLCRRLQLLTCNLFGGAGVGEDLATVGRVFSNFFHHEGFLDVVPSDVMAGFLLVRFQQKMNQIRNREARVQLIAAQGLQFSRLPPQYGTKSTCVLSVASMAPTPLLEDAQSIVTAAEQGVVLRPLSGKQARALLDVTATAELGVGMIASKDAVNGKPCSGEDPRESEKSQQQLEQQGSRPELLASQQRHSAAPSRYSPRTAVRRAPSWNSSELADPQSPPATLPQLLPAPCTSAFKTRTSFFSALEVLARNRETIKEQQQQPAAAAEDDPHGGINFAEFSDVARFSYFALAAYSTLMFLYMQPCCGACKLCTYGCCPEAALGACCGPDSSSPRPARAGAPPSETGKQVDHDNRCHSHESAMRQIVAAPNTELVYAQFSNDIETRPYAVFLDFEKEALVITVRGTLSLEDCVADAMSEPQPLEEVGKQHNFDGTGRHVHSGFLKSAQWICQDLLKHSRVKALLAAVAGSCPAGMTMDRDSLDTSSSSLGTPLKPRTVTRLVVVGHSLGAGVAALLAMLLRSEYPTLHCFGYGAPGSTMDAATAHEAKSYITSVVLGDDMVGCLSFHSLSELREQVLDCIVRSRCSKMSILQSAMFKECSEGVLAELLHPPGQEPASSFRAMFLKYKAHMAQQRAAFLPCPLFIPGKVVHLRQIGKEKDRSSLLGGVARVFVPVIEPQVSFFEEIKVSASMITDHMPDLYCHELSAMLRDWAIERHAQHSALKAGAARAVNSGGSNASNDNRV